LVLVSQILKNELSLSYNFLIENSSIDLSGAQKLPIQNNYFKLLKLTSFYTFYFYYTKDKITFFCGNLNKYSTTINSIDSIYNNANWLERETSEMYNLYYRHKVDVRRILLDYSKLENPLLKKFPCEGYNDLFYSIFENQVVIKSSETIEL